MTKLVSIALTAAALFAVPACGGGSPCEKAISKVEKLSGMSLEGDMRKEAVAKCEKEPKAQVDCVLEADTMEQLMACK